MYHVAFLQKDPLSRVLQGVKRAEIRLSKNAHPARLVRAGDILLFKLVGGDIKAAAEVTHVHHFDRLAPADIIALGDLVAPLIGLATSTYFAERAHIARNAVIIEFAPPRRAKVPAKHTPVGVFSGWVSNAQVEGLTIG